MSLGKTHNEGALRGGFGGGLEEFVNQRLVRLSLLCRDLAKLRKQPRVEANGNELFGLAGFRAANATSALQFCIGRFGDVRKIDLLIGNMLGALCGLPGVR